MCFEINESFPVLEHYRKVSLKRPIVCRLCLEIENTYVGQCIHCNALLGHMSCIQEWVHFTPMCPSCKHPTNEINHFHKYRKYYR